MKTCPTVGVFGVQVFDIVSHDLCIPPPLVRFCILNARFADRSDSLANDDDVPSLCVVSEVFASY